MVHIGHEFVKVFDSYKLPVAKEAIARIKQLYKTEDLARHKPPAERVAIRQEYAKPTHHHYRKIDVRCWARDEFLSPGSNQCQKNGLR
jgi:hypothetical protein